MAQQSATDMPVDVRASDVQNLSAKVALPLAWQAIRLTNEVERLAALRRAAAGTEQSLRLQDLPADEK